MKGIVGVSLTLAVSAALFVLSPISKHGVPVVHAQTGCTNATLTGNYGFIQPSGFIAPGHSVTGAEVPWEGVGVLTFDGAGNFSANYSVSVNGNVFTNQTASGPYTVNTDCTGSLTFTSGNAAGYAANLVIVGGGTEIFAVATGAGDTAAWDAKRQ
jgi:hypothetical protein